MNAKLLYILLLIQLVACNKKTKETISSSEEQLQTASEKYLTPFYVGSYTDEGSEGIYRYAIDTSGQLVNLGLVAKTNNPSFLTRSKDHKYLLAVNEVDDNNTGYISSFAITASEDSLIAINSVISAGANPCYITTNQKGYVLTANYSGGNIALHYINPNGELSDVLDVQQHQGGGTHIRQDKPHAHSSRFIAGTDKIITADLGTNELWLSTLDTINHTISDQVIQLAMAAEAGPRHLEFHPSGKWIYVVNELDATVTQLSNSKEGYKITKTISTLPEEYKQANKCADIHISKDGKFLYASNRGHDSIVMYSVNLDTGNLTYIGYESTKGDTPRNFAISPDGKYMLVANQDSNNIVSFHRDQETGLLTYIGAIQALKPVCILF